MKKRHVIENNSLKVWKDGKKALTLHPQNKPHGPFVYRLGREIFIL